jgi:lipoprotein-anchoring transpeptidase ErfK/SrfK
MTQRPIPRRRTVLAAVLPSAVLLVPTAAHAQAPAPPVSPAPPAAPVTTTLKLTTEKARTGQALKGEKWRALAVTDEFVPGTKVRVQFKAAKRTSTKTVTLKQQKDGEKGYVRIVVPRKVSRSSRVVVRASIAAGQPIAPIAAKTKVVLQATPNVTSGERGLAVRMLQDMLAAKGYVIGKKGVYDARTARAVLAFRKVTGKAKNTRADSSVFKALRAGKGTFRVRFPNHGRHVEGDVDRQVLALIDKGKAVRIYHTSPGAPSTPTIRGSYKVYRKDPGTNAKGMYRSAYFIRGYAIHGYPSVPTYNASHGCFRVPMSDATSIFNWITMGMRVDTY